MNRLIVTGEKCDGTARIVHDGHAPLTDFGGGFHFAQVWGSDVPPTFPQKGAKPHYDDLFPGAGGYRFVLMRIEPREVVARARQPRVAGQSTPDDNSDASSTEAFGMHRTDTVDLGVVIAGTVTIELDDGTITELGTGDHFIQNGTSHKWSNTGDKPCEIAVVLIGGHRRSCEEVPDAAAPPEKGVG